MLRAAPCAIHLGQADTPCEGEMAVTMSLPSGGGWSSCLARVGRPALHARPPCTRKNSPLHRAPCLPTSPRTATPLLVTICLRNCPRAARCVQQMVSFSSLAMQLALTDVHPCIFPFIPAYRCRVGSNRALESAKAQHLSGSTERERGPGPSS